MINSFRVTNFRSIKDLKIKIAPITVIYGHNSTGKSSLLYSLCVLRNIVLNPNQQPLAFFNLTFANLGGFEKVVFDHRKGNFIGFENEVKKDNTELKYEVQIRGTEGKFTLKVDGEIKAEFIVATSFPYPLNQQDQKTIELNGKLFNVTWNGIISKVTPAEQTPELLEKAKKIAELLNSPIEVLRRMDFIPLKRGFTKPNYSPVALTPLLLAEDEVATTLANDIYLQGKLSTYLERILDREFRIHVPPGVAMFSLYTVEKPLGLTVDVINDGFGVNQVIWLLAKCLRDVDLVCIEEPEIHLHPTAVRKLAKAIVHMVKHESKRFIISTHSESFVTALLSLISEDELKPEELSCYLSKRERKETVLEHQQVEEGGQIKGGLASFMEAELEDLKTFLKARD